MLIVSPEYGNLILEKIDAGNLKGPILPGSQTFFSQHDFGTVIVQKIEAHNYSLRYFILKLLKQVTLIFTDDPTAMRVKLLLENNLSIKVGDRSSQVIKQGQFVIYNGSETFAASRISLQTDYRIFEASYPVHTLKDLLKPFPSLSDYLENTSGKKTAPIRPAYDTPIMRHIVADLLRSPYDEKLRKVYFENKVNDFLFEILAQSNAKPADKIKLSAEERAAFSKAREIIENDLSQHLTIKEISRIVHLNEHKLKNGFKQVYGIGLFELLLESRMSQAHQLIVETTMPLKEIAAITGYDYYNNFAAAFNKHFGYSPASLRNKK